MRQSAPHDSETAGAVASWPRSLRWAALGLLAVAALLTTRAAVAQGTEELPLPWVAVVWCAVCLAAMWVSTRRGVRALWFNLAAVILILGLAEGYVGSSGDVARRQQQLQDGSRFFVRDDVLGHHPEPNFSTTDTLRYDGELIYDVRYTIGPNGLRIAPRDRGGESIPCVLFFGCSYTFGEGVNDAETMPYQVGLKSGGNLRVHNFGFSGYGPHHMLAQTESGMVERVVDCAPTHAIYQAHQHHVLRAAGKWWWDSHGPRFELREDGTPARAGNFDDSRGLARQSLLARRFADQQTIEPEDVSLFLAIVERTQRLLATLYPGIEFHILLWNEGDPRELADSWQRAGMRVHHVGSILPPREDGQAAYKIKHDIHPNALAHSLIADYVVREILDK